MKTKNVKVFLSAAIVLLIAWALVSCDKKKDSTPPVVKTDLTAAVTAANALVLSTHEGVAAGDYLKGSQAPLIVAIAQAQAVIDNTASTQVQVRAAIAHFAAAVATYESLEVTPIEPGFDFPDTAEELAEWCGGEVTWRADDLAVVRATYA